LAFYLNFYLASLLALAPLELALANEQGRGEGGRRKKKKRSGCICQNLETLTRWKKKYPLSPSISP
jgi:hypothetical protein